MLSPHGGCQEILFPALDVVLEVENRVEGSKFDLKMYYLKKIDKKVVWIFYCIFGMGIFLDGTIAKA